MKGLKVFGMMLAAGMMITGCASVAHVEKDETVNFSRYKTFAWVPVSDKKENGKHVSSLTEQKIQKAVDKELEKAGWQENSSNPDVLLSYDVLVERSVREVNDPLYSRPFNRWFYNPYTRRWGAIYYPSIFMGYETNEYPVREGTLTITMMDAHTEKTIWQGWTTDEVNSHNLTAREVQSSVKSIFRKFDLAKR